MSETWQLFSAKFLQLWATRGAEGALFPPSLFGSGVADGESALHACKLAYMGSMWRDTMQFAGASTCTCACACATCPRTGLVCAECAQMPTCIVPPAALGDAAFHRQHLAVQGDVWTSTDGNPRAAGSAPRRRHITSCQTVMQGQLPTRFWA